LANVDRHNRDQILQHVCESRDKKDKRNQYVHFIGGNRESRVDSGEKESNLDNLYINYWKLELVGSSQQKFAPGGLFSTYSG
jgi:hypothetical protein